VPVPPCWTASKGTVIGLPQAAPRKFGLRTCALGQGRKSGLYCTFRHDEKPAQNGARVVLRDYRNAFYHSYLGGSSIYAQKDNGGWFG